MGYTVHQLLEASAAAHPNRVAVVNGERSITYSQLETRANQVAHVLIESGVSRGDRVAVCLEKSIEAVAALYGIMKAGAAYVPLDVGAPSRRLAYIAGNCAVRGLVTSTAQADHWEALLSGPAPVGAVVVMDESERPLGLPTGVPCFGSAQLEAVPATPPAVPVIELDLAYILYTSGSTGDPKGVMLSHLNALTFVRWAAAEFDVVADDRLSSHAPFHFDLSVFDLYVAAFAGAAVVLVPPKVALFPVEVGRFIERHDITVWYSVPSILSMLALRGGLREGSLPSLRRLLFAGEVFPTPYLRRLMGLLPHVRFANLYGPTETNVCTWYEVPELAPDDHAPIPIGKAIANVEVFSVTEDGKRAEPGEIGMLVVRGSTVTRGYWGDPERSASALFANPFDALGDPLYRTGDLVRQDPDGNYRFLGRKDTQIKSRGYRIEPGDIEAALYAHPAVLECAVVPVPDDLCTNRIKAVVVAEDVDEAELARFCSERIPRYMIPEIWDFRSGLAKTSTGKIDRQSVL